MTDDRQGAASPGSTGPIMWLKWFPWRFFIRRLARSHGFVDPLALLVQFNRFSQPAEVLAPTELLRAGIVLQARGLINSQAIQHNLDWVWPYWVVRQFDPKDESFIPRAFSISHINLTHRNWTAVGVPGCAEMPVIDPRGLIMPFFDSWSLDFWLYDKEGKSVVPSRMAEVDQRMLFDEGVSVVTTVRHPAGTIESRVEVLLQSGRPFVRAVVTAEAPPGSFLAASVRPYNPEGVSFIASISQRDEGRELLIDKDASVHFETTPDRLYFSRYRDGDVFAKIMNGDCEKTDGIRCNIGMATAAAVFEIREGRKK